MNNVPKTRVPDAVATGNTFASSRGLLPWPVDGHYTVVKPFGRQSHPIYKNLQIDNAGIDLGQPAEPQSSRSTTAKCRQCSVPTR